MFRPQVFLRAQSLNHGLNMKRMMKSCSCSSFPWI